MHIYFNDIYLIKDNITHFKKLKFIHNLIAFGSNY